MAHTLHTEIINIFLEQRREEIDVQITVEEVDNTILSKKFINGISKKMDVNVFTVTLEDLIDNIEEKYPSASIRIVDENKLHTLNLKNENILVSTEIIVKFKFLSGQL
jgi:predicted RNase H-like nuclease